MADEQFALGRSLDSSMDRAFCNVSSVEEHTLDKEGQPIKLIWCVLDAENAFIAAIRRSSRVGPQDPCGPQHFGLL